MIYQPAIQYIRFSAVKVIQHDIKQITGLYSNLYFTVGQFVARWHEEGAEL